MKALVGLALIQSTLARLEAAGVVSSEMLREICNAAIDQHNESPAGDQPWTKAVITLIRDIYNDLEPAKQSVQLVGRQSEKAFSAG